MSKKGFLEYYSKEIDFAFKDDNPWTAMNAGVRCCKDGHQTFYGAIVKTKEWQAWYKEQMRRFRLIDTPEQLPVFDIDESIGVGALGDHHVQEFLKFVREQYQPPEALSSNKGIEVQS